MILLLAAWISDPGRLRAEEITTTIIPSTAPEVTEAAAPPPAETKPPAKARPAKKETAAASPEPPQPKAPATDDGGAPSRGKGASQSIAVLVNDEPITAYEIEQRQRFIGLNANINEKAKQAFQSMIKNPNVNARLKKLLDDTIAANKGKTKDEVIAIFEQRKKEFAQSLQRQAVDSARAIVLPGLKKQALEELIDEHLKLQEAKRLNVLASDDDVNQVLTTIAQKNKMTLDQFAAQMKSMGTDINTMRSRFKAELSWRDVVRRRFGNQISITDRDVDRLVASSPAAGDDDVELQLQRITLAMPAKIDQKLMAQRLAEADAIYAGFAGCQAASALAAGIAGAKFEDLGSRKPSSIPEPTRSLLLSAADGTMVPPSVGAGGVELWAVCGRKVLKADDQKREVAQAELRSKEFEILAKKHLKDLRQDAAIEYR
jgi:peptidyl-prolyl cis-trans isomerase SurA